MHRLLWAATAVALSASTAAADDAFQINGWYPCSVAGTVISTNPVPFECAEVRVPLCHAGICESDRTIELFVRRLLATNPYPDVPRKAVWFLQGGPGGSSYASTLFAGPVCCLVQIDGHLTRPCCIVVDARMQHFNATMGGAADLYTMDHRGTGRSFFLDCQAAQAFADDGLDGTGLFLDEMPNCLKDVMFQIDGHLNAFSITSAAKDLEYLVDHLHDEDEEVFVYGVSYGTLLVERLMHLAPPKVIGYILSGVSQEDNPSFATTSTERLYPGRRLAEYCEEDEFCGSYFQDEIEEYGGLTEAWLALYDKLDSGEAACSDLLAEATSYSYPSDFLRETFDRTYVKDATMRTLVPAILYRIARCADYDIPFLRVALGLSEPTTRRLEAYDQVEEISPVLHWLIKASEMWSYPSPSWEDEIGVYNKGVFTTDLSNEFVWTCALAGDFTSSACADVVEMYAVDVDSWDGGPFVYERDEYYQKFAPIPANTSVILFNGGLDFQTVSESAQHEYDNLVGDNKMLINFDYGVHGTVFIPTMSNDVTNCGALIMAYYVVASGDLNAVNTSCMTQLPAISFNDTKAIELKFPGLGDLFDGEVPGETESSNDGVSH